MCVIPKMPKMPTATASPVQRVASPDNTEAIRQSSLEARLRRRRAGAAADVLTGPSGIPATATMGGIAQ